MSLISDRKFFRYYGPLELNNFLSFMHKVLIPVVQLQTEADVDRFLDMNQEFEEQSEIMKKGFISLGDYYQAFKEKFRVLAILHSFRKLPKEFKQLKEAGELLANREEVRVGYISDIPL